jgi:putative ABC transport system substrate-binding protein
VKPILARVASAWPLLLTVLLQVAVPAAQAQKVVKVGVLSPGQSRFPPIEVFDRTLQEQGWVLGRTMVIEYRFSSGRADVDAENAAELVDRQQVDLLVAWGASPALAAKGLADRVPVVFVAVNGPVERGLVQSLAHPGGRITGVTYEAGDGIFSKQLQLLRDCVPGLRRVAFLTVEWEPVRPSARQRLTSAAKTLGIELLEFELHTPQDLKEAMVSAKHTGAQAVFVLPTSFASAYRRQIAEFALAQQLPSMHGLSEAAAAGALMSYSPSLSDVAHQAALQVHRILQGAKPGDLPVEEPTRFEFLINMKTAKALGLTVPRSLLLRADRVIE